MIIIPTIFATSKNKFEERFNKLIKVSKNIQIDFMDGRFVRTKSLSPAQIPNLKKYKRNFEAHLMLYHPERYLKLLKNKGFKKIIFHYESTKNPELMIDKIKKGKLKCYMAINPETKLEKIVRFLPKVDGVLFLGVRPGREHQSFIPSVYQKIKKLKSIHKKIKIQADGGVNERVIIKLARLKVDYVNSGSFISESKNPKEAFKKLSSLFKKRGILYK